MTFLIILTFLMGFMMPGVIIIEHLLELDFDQVFQKCKIHRVLSEKITIKKLHELGGHS